MSTYAEVNAVRRELGLIPLRASAGVWREELHPRGRDGRFIEKFGFVRLFRSPSSTRSYATGRVDRIEGDGVVVRTLRGDVVKTSPELIEHSPAVAQLKPTGTPPVPGRRPYAPYRPIVTGDQSRLDTSSWAGLRDSLNGQDLVIFDTETTGLDVEGDDRPVELAAVRIRNGKVVDRFHTLVNPGRPVDPAAAAVHGIGDAEIADAPTPDAALQSFLDWAGDAILGAHNANFDVAGLQSIAEEFGLQFDPERTVIDTLALARALLPKKSDVVPNHRLGTLATHFDVNLANWHRADADAEAAGLLLDKLLGWATENNAAMQPLSNLERWNASFKNEWADYLAKLDELRPSEIPTMPLQ